MSLKSSIFMAAAMAAMAGMGVDKKHYTFGGSYEEKPYPKPADHTKWKIGDNIIHAKDEKTAVKYAKKRGLWKEGMIIELVK